jgi:hypothetical protein
MQFKSKKEEKLYNTWASMKLRCKGVSKHDILNYFARGISYDPKWEKFSNFWDDMQNGWERGLTLDRINNNGNYCKENCRWVNRKVQAMNRRNTRLFQFNGENHTLTDWSPIVGIKKSTLGMRFYCRKWSIEKTLSTPLLQ